MFMAAALLLTITAFVGSCQKEEVAKKPTAAEKNDQDPDNPPAYPEIYMLDWQTVDGEEIDFDEVAHTYFDPQTNTVMAFSTEAGFNEFVENCSDDELKIKWEVSKAIREAVAAQEITDPLTEEELFALIPENLVKKHDLTLGGHSEEEPKIIGLCQLHEGSYLGRGTGCSHFFWGLFPVNMTNIYSCGANWNDRASHATEFFGLHIVFEHINLGGAGLFIGGVPYGEIPLVAPSSLQWWDNRISSLI
jgi:hypothetical protein